MGKFDPVDRQFLRQPWIKGAVCQLLSRNRQAVIEQPIVQILHVDCPRQPNQGHPVDPHHTKGKTSHLTGVVSDRWHHIKCVFSRTCIEAFAKRKFRFDGWSALHSLQTLHSISGGFVCLRNFTVRFTPSNREVYLFIDSLDFFGGEATFKCGDPVDVHLAADLLRHQQVSTVS